MELEGKRYMVRSPDDGVILGEKFIGNDEHEVFYNLFEQENHVVTVYRSHVESFNCNIVNSQEVFISSTLNNSESIMLGLNSQALFWVK
ncbi:hypothetical protein P4K64_00715 [Bacillus cereus]